VKGGLARVFGGDGLVAGGWGKQNDFVNKS